MILIVFNIFKAVIVAELVESALLGDVAALTQVLSYLIPGIALAVLATWGASYAARHAGTLTESDLKSQLVGHVARAVISQVETLESGEIITRINNDTAAVRRFLAEDLPNVLFQPLMFLCSSLFLLAIDWRLFVGSYILLPFSFIAANSLNKRGAAYSADYYKGLDDVTTMVRQCLDGVVTVKSFNLGRQMIEKCRAAFTRAFASLRRREMCDSLSLPFYFLTYESPRILCVVVGGLLTWQGEMSIGSLIAATQLVSYVSAPALALMRLMNGVRKLRVSTDRLQAILDLEGEASGGNSTIDGGGRNCVEFRDVTFGYSPGLPVLRDISFAVPRQGVVALVGGSGEGKSTVLNLLCRFCEPQSGNIQFFGTELAGYNLHALRDSIAYVPQDSQLFPGSIGYNILLGKENADLNEVCRVAITCHVSEFADTLPEGLDTCLGERGIGLSGGQRQRVAVARAALKGAPLILLDEPTAALDRLSEARINSAIQELGRHSAVLMVSHRLSTIAVADHILVLEQGRVAEQGSFKELTLLDGVFARIFAGELKEVAGCGA
jgi:ABC-type multidrug transport system fused ATPase/permease subunit